VSARVAASGEANRPLSQLGATLTFVNDLETIKAVQAVFDNVYESVRGVPDMDWIVLYNPQPKVIEDLSAARGGNVLGLENVTNDQIGKHTLERSFSSAWLLTRS
jgi:hypothetical protein